MARLDLDRTIAQLRARGGLELGDMPGPDIRERLAQQLLRRAVLDLSTYKPVPATLADANQIANGLQAVQNVVNAIDNLNFAAGKIFDPAKLMQNSAVDGDPMVWDNAASIFKRATDKPVRVGALAGYPADILKALKGDGSWSSVASVLRKTAQKDVVNTVAETDLLNGEITIPANALGANGFALLFATGDYLNNTGGNQTYRLKVKLGATTLWDSGVSGVFVTSVNRRGWTIMGILSNAGATNDQRLAGTLMQQSSAGVATTGWGFIDAAGALGPFGGTSAEDTTGAKALVLSVIHGAVNAALSMRLNHAEVIIFAG